MLGKREVSNCGFEAPKYKFQIPNQYRLTKQGDFALSPESQARCLSEVEGNEMNKEDKLLLKLTILITEFELRI